jgi:subtilase family serine protease
MGVTIVYSSGDNGVAGMSCCIYFLYGRLLKPILRFTGNRALCLNPTGEQTTTGKIFNPSFPSTCPFITSIGATQVNPGAKVTDPESACEQVIFSGGGFSNYFGMPGMSIFVSPPNNTHLSLSQTTKRVRSQNTSKKIHRRTRLIYTIRPARCVPVHSAY